MEYASLVQQQKKYFQTKATLPYAFRIVQLKKLLALVHQYETAIQESLFKDLHKSTFEAWGVEIGVVETEIRYFIKHLDRWMRPKRIRTPLFHFRAKSVIRPIPYGNTLIIAPWNYPFLLSIRPLIGAIAAGNTAIIKPPEQAVYTSKVIEEMINQHFDAAYVHVVNTDAEGSKALLENKFDFIFFTGGTEIGRRVYMEAAKHLTPVALELGGKNPCLVDETANLNVTAARITWGKFSNSGQTCVAPDYLLVHNSIKQILIDKIIQNIEAEFSNELIRSADYGRIINDRHLQRIKRLMQGEKILYGGDISESEKFIAPTIIEITDLHSPIMQEEIFGPVLTIIGYDHLQDAIDIMNEHPDPLVMYIFSENRFRIDQLAREFSSGDMVVNEVVLHFGHLHMPIGGKGNSGIGKYQGKHSFSEFSHKKSEMHKHIFPELSVRYPPYNEKKLKQLKWLFKHLLSR